MSKIKPQRLSSAKSFVTKKYNKCIWTCGNVDDLGIYLPQNSSVGYIQSSTMRCSSRQLRQWKAIVSDPDGGGSAGWDDSNYQFQQFKPFLHTLKSDPNFSKYSDNGFSIIHDSNSSIYFGATNHWLIPNNGLRVWQKVDDRRIDRLNQYSGLKNDSFIGQSWYKPKQALTAGGFSGMRYQSQRPYGFNVFVDYSTAKAGPCSQQQPYIHTVQKITDIYNKTRRISKFKIKDGVIISTQRTFKSLRRTNTSLTNTYSQTAHPYLLDYLQQMNPSIDSNLLVVFAAKSATPMNINIKTDIFDSHYQDSRTQMWDGSTSADNIFSNYNQAFNVYDDGLNQSKIPSNLSYGAISTTGIRQLEYTAPVNRNWKLFWNICPIKISGVQRGMNDIVYHAGRQLVNVDKIKLSFYVNRPNRNKQFYIDFVDAIVSQQIFYATVKQRPINVTSTIFNGDINNRTDGRYFRSSYINQQQIIKRNAPPFFFKTRPTTQDITINYTQRRLQSGQVRNVGDMRSDDIISLNNFRNTKIAYEVF